LALMDQEYTVPAVDRTFHKVRMGPQDTWDTRPLTLPLDLGGTPEDHTLPKCRMAGVVLPRLSCLIINNGAPARNSNICHVHIGSQEGLVLEDFVARPEVPMLLDFEVHHCISKVNNNKKITCTTCQGIKLMVQLYSLV
jgi:hypothetical protein